MTETIIAIVWIVFTLIGAAISQHVIPYLNSISTLKQRENIQATVNTLVKAAWQISETHGFGGPQRKAWVLAQFKNLGFKVTDSELDAMIEAAVLGLKTGLDQ